MDSACVQQKRQIENGRHKLWKIHKQVNKTLNKPGSKAENKTHVRHQTQGTPTIHRHTADAMNTMAMQTEEVRRVNEAILNDEKTKGKVLKAYTWIYRWDSPSEFRYKIKDKIVTAKRAPIIQDGQEEKTPNIHNKQLSVHHHPPQGWTVKDQGM